MNSPSWKSDISGAEVKMHSSQEVEDGSLTKSIATTSSVEDSFEPCTKKQKLSCKHIGLEKAYDLFPFAKNDTLSGDISVKSVNIQSEPNTEIVNDGQHCFKEEESPEDINNHNEADTELNLENNKSLKELYVLDESNGFDDGDAEALSDSSSNHSYDIPDDEIEALLEEGIGDTMIKDQPRKPLPFKNDSLREKLIKLANRVGMPLSSSVEGSNVDKIPNPDSNNSKDTPPRISDCENSSNDILNPDTNNSKDDPPQILGCGNSSNLNSDPNSLDVGLHNYNSKDENADTSKVKGETADLESSKPKTNNIDDEEEECKVFKIIDDDKNELEYEVRPKFVLEELEQNHFDLLPEGWVKLTHRSGMPLYLHRKSRVCTLSRPYYLGPGSNRNHSIPLEAIPCMQYRRALEKEKQKKEEMAETSNTDVSNLLAAGKGPSPLLRCARIETVEENRAYQSLKHKEVRDYCSKLFRFKSINSVRYKCWGTRKLIASHKEAERLQRPTLPNGTKLLRFEIRNADGTPTNRPQKEWIMNPAGKSYVCILHEYVQHALKSQPSYEFKELQNPSTPYSAEISIDGISYGKAFGTSKKQAKLLAAKAALEILIPDMKSKIDPDAKATKAQGTDAHLSIFDLIRIEDPRVIEFSNKTTEPSPYKMLLTCLQRNHSLPTVNCNYVVSKKEKKRNEFTITVGGHSATVVCKNKRDGKQRASQAILQALHPHVTTWGSLLRLYGNRSVKNIKEKKQQEKEITLLQSKASLNKPNFAILAKLREEMQKLHDKKNLLQPIGKFVPPDGVSVSSFSSSDLDKLDLGSSSTSPPASSIAPALISIPALSSKPALSSTPASSDSLPLFVKVPQPIEVVSKPI
ncbi:microprocessor complex subunit DGCR8 [Nilaparvata lugens]|uniref:microprocessor complex subunit DGCR8 n=1 Tax=Nilaparvata lugens TaxID=108931 RepID=UPI00193E537A|nr:microprocessor complex subunit DGCR8 [Nilaparvata lugens]XP_039300317.1 microprocessor complex subunit DGCR8 [Nilaparvata lugens]XP_039300318.1 microprocessor complex subunit DGCR8 [Nilaparvata lugens]XP_039300319.1 microprocessor complex subunit DGCR8 [Nilaparvata lugens]